MDFMDLDEDLESNPVNDFLKNKLEEIRYENIKLQETFDELKQQVEDASNEVQDFSHNIFIQKSWIKIVHNKYAVWFLIENKTEGCLKDCQLILRWNAPSSFLYSSSVFNIPESCSLFNKSFQCVNEIKKKSYIVAVMERPEFLEQLSIEISGMLSCTLENNEVFIDVPDVTIISKDITDKNKIVSVYKLIESNIPDFVSCLACSDKINLILKCSGFSQNIFSSLEIDASLYRSNFDEYNGRSFFIAHRLSPVFDGCIIELNKTETSDISRIVIYYRCQESLLAFVHHLFQTIKSLILLPEEYEISLHSQSLEECEQLLKKCILKEIEFAQKLTGGPNFNTNNLKESMVQLYDIERETDEAYVRLCVAEDRIEEPEKDYTCD